MFMDDKQGRGLAGPFLKIAKILLTLALPAWGAAATRGEVTIDWKAIPGVRQYELEVSHGTRPVLHQRLPPSPTRWTARLPYARYTYRLRAIDRSGQAGPWAEPVHFSVAPPAPTPLLPANEQTVYDLPEKRITLKWSAVPGIKRYQVTLVQSGKKSQAFTASAASFALPFLLPGSYSWQVAPLLDYPEPELEIPTSALSGFRVELVEGAENYAADLQQVGLLVPKDGSRLQVRQFVCLYRPREPAASPVACGTLSEKTPTQLRVNLTSQRIKLEDGNHLEVRLPQDPRRQPASVSNDDFLYDVTFERGGFPYNITVGLSAGMHSLLPSLEIQTALRPNLSLGLSYEYAYTVKTDESVRIYGAFLTLTRYFGERSYSGFFAKGGAGVYAFSDTVFGNSEGPAVAPALSLSAGWQWRASQQGFNLGLGAGAQWIAPTKLSQIQIPLSGFAPLVSFELGYAF